MLENQLSRGSQHYKAIQMRKTWASLSSGSDLVNKVINIYCIFHATLQSLRALCSDFALPFHSIRHVNA